MPKLTPARIEKKDIILPGPLSSFSPYACLNPTICLLYSKGEGRVFKD